MRVATLRRMSGEAIENARPVREKRPKRPGVLIAGVVILVLSGVLSIVYGSSVIGEGEKYFRPSQVSTGWMMIGTSVLQLLLAVAVWIGWSWARWVVAVFTVGAFLAGIIMGIGAVGLANLLAVVLLFLPSSNLWYSDLRYMRRQRAGR
jgi:hypothetical protein